MSESRSAGGLAEGDIYTCTFVKVGADEGGVLACAAGERPIGISFKDTRRSPYISTDDFHGSSGEPVSYYTAGARCMLRIIGTVNAGDRLKASTNGAGIAVTADADFYGATALRDGISGDTIPVVVDIGQRGTA